MTAREQLLFAAASYRNCDAEVFKWRHVQTAMARIANLERAIRYQLWIEAVIRFRREG